MGWAAVEHAAKASTQARAATVRGEGMSKGYCQGGAFCQPPALHNPPRRGPRLAMTALARNRTMKVGAWLTFLVILTAADVNANDKLSIRVSPAVAFAPATLRVQTTIEVDAANRSIEII